jgi:hypothetical protein
MTAPMPEITTRDQFAAVIAHLSNGPYAYKIPLYRAAQDGLISLCEIVRGGTPPLKRLDRTGRPVVVLIGDDDYASTGPDGWDATRKLIYWARGAFVHGTGGTAEDYTGAVVMAVCWRRFLLIETSSDHVRQWAEAVQKAPIRINAVYKMPKAFDVHPIPPAAGLRH